VDKILLYVSHCRFRILFNQTYSFHGVVQIAAVDHFALQQATLAPPCLPVPLLVDEQPAPELLGLNLEETSKLLKIHGGVQLEVTLDGRRHHVVLDLVHKDAEVVLHRVNVDLWVVEVGWCGANEFGAGGAEELLKQGKSIGSTALEPVELLAVLLPQGSVDGVVEPGGVEGHADGDERVHLVVLLSDRVVLCVLLEVLRPRDVNEDVAEHADGVGVAAHHHVGETHVVVGGEVGGHDTGEHGLLVELNVVERLERQTEVSEQTVHAQQTDDGEVAQHLVQRAVAVLSRVESGILAALHGGQLLADLRPLDERVQDVEHAVAAPGVGVVPQELYLLLIVVLERGLLAVAAEAVELVDELVDYVPGPVVLPCVSPASPLPQHVCHPYIWDFQIDGALGVQDVVEEVAVVVVARKLCFERRLELEWGCRGCQLRMNVLVVGHGGHAVLVVHATVVLDLLPVVVHHGLLLGVRLVVWAAPGRVAILVLWWNTLTQTHGC
jgi:hypothetical protein